MSKCAHITSVHFSNSNYRRIQQRALPLRPLWLVKDECKCIGLSVLEPEQLLNSKSATLLKLVSWFNRKLCSIGPSLPFPISKLVEYDAIIVGPDHIITSITKEVLNSIFLQLKNEGARVKLQIFLKSILATGAYQTQMVLFKRK